MTDVKSESPMTTKCKIYDAVVVGDVNRVHDLVTQAVMQDLAPQELLKDALTAAMTEVGDRFEKGEFFVPEMLVAARAMKAGVTVLKPLLGQESLESAGRVVIGTVAGDVHDIGKNLVIMMMEAAGFRVIDLGVDVSADVFVRSTREHLPHLVAMSALLTTTMLSMKTTILALEKAGLRSRVSIMVGGAPVTQQFADEIGADMYAEDAGEAVRKARKALQDRPI